MKDNEEALVEPHHSQTIGTWHTIEIFNKTTKKRISGYGTFNTELEARTFAQEHHIELIN